MQTKRHIRAMAALLTGVVAFASGSAVAAGPAVLLPPDLDYAKICAPVAAPPLPVLDRDWTKWQGEPVALPAEQLHALSAEYLRGSERVEASPDTALRLLTYLETQPNPDRRRLDRLIGRTLIEAGRSDAEMQEGEARLARALAAGETRAALDLATIYGPNGPAALRNPGKARALAQTAAASGNAEGKLMFATILNGDPNIAPEQKNAATEAALLSLVGEIVKGNCSYLNTVGLLYMRGGLVELDVPVAIKWFEQAAETGDARIQERIGDLISGPRVEVNDFELALHYYRLAADQGRPVAALKIGQDFATGLVHPQDLDEARRYLTIAADAGVRDGNLWLARLYYGNFGGVRDWANARRYYRSTLAIGAFDAELVTEYGIAVIDNSAGPDDLAEAKSHLTDAALSGSGIAAVKVGELLIDEARADPTLYAEVETFMRLGDSLGRSEAARHMAELSLCAGPLFNPGAVAGWSARALALGADALILNQGTRLLGSANPAEHQQGEALIRQLAMSGDARGVGFALAQLRSEQGMLDADPDLRTRLETFVAGNAAEPVFMREFELALIGAELDLPDGSDKLDAALTTLDAYIAAGDADAVMLKADLLKRHRGASPAELAPLYQAAADGGATKAMRELGSNLLADPPADVEAARAWLQKAAAGGDIKAALRLIDTSADTAPGDIRTIANSGAICSVDAMVTVAKTYAATNNPEAPVEAGRWLATATAVVGDRASDLVRIAGAYRGGAAGPGAVADAQPLLARALQLGDPGAAMMLADGHIKGTWPDADPDIAHQLLAGLAADGDAAAATKLLAAIADGEIEAPASEVLALAEDNRGRFTDNGATLVKLARLDEDGAFGNPDPARQFEWLRTAADAGDPGAMMRLYRSYASGIGVAASPDTALAWLQKAADIGDPRAAKELAAAYTVGFGTTADPERAAFWRARAEVN